MKNAFNTITQYSHTIFPSYKLLRAWCGYQTVWLKSKWNRIYEHFYICIKIKCFGVCNFFQAPVILLKYMLDDGTKVKLWKKYRYGEKRELKCNKCYMIGKIHINKTKFQILMDSTDEFFFYIQRVYVYDVCILHEANTAKSNVVHIVSVIYYSIYCSFSL